MPLTKSCGGMGFTDFMAFDNALLARQRWRLKIPECIPGLNDDRNYYPNFGFLEADRGAKASWAWPWSSLIKGRDIGSGVL
ncbi:hypothetical protein RHMOL_Rhmol04G0032700 [Rhododendron molle]|uniref:Uncharacterized protein n=1 Tax=Rhododendron molle TaxID=49168 RepID=A0ACC0NY98_RHOML|nr:hypothetical protein RHMOL_Rhmol04G0032700 [Rhododendron molle]